MIANNLTIRRVGYDHVDEVVSYVCQARKLLFPMLDHRQLPLDLRLFAQTYLHAPVGAFVEARNESGRLVGVIGIIPYDYRFPFLDLPAAGVVEVVRLYVDPQERRQGLATALFDALYVIAVGQAVSTMYLHTHPFLKGAYDFWLKCGFQTQDVRDHGGFSTIHMSHHIPQNKSTK